MTYEKVIEDLFRKHRSVQSAGFSPDTYRPGLEGMKQLDDALGNPSRQFRSIHVAGTNGKGSVSSMIAASLAGKGYRTGLYTSPHLLDFRERMRLVGEELVGRDHVLDFLENHAPLLENKSFFEITTAMAFDWFAREKVDYAVIETGLGGRLDSTNIVLPEISVVTGIGLDHCAILGSTRAAIAAEKAGIFKSGVPAVTGYRDTETAPVFIETASRLGSPLVFASDFPLPDASSLDLKGPHQDENLRTALVTLGLLGIEPDMDAISRAAELCGLRGRWERLRESPEVIADIGHNPPALEGNFVRLKMSGKPLSIVYGVMADKALDDIAPLFPECRLYLGAPHTERALPAENLLERIKALRPDLEVRFCGDVNGAVGAALRESSANTLIYIGGSTFVVSEAMEYLG